MRLSRVRFVGMTREQVEQVRRQPRPAFAARDPADVAVPLLARDVQEGAVLGPGGAAGDDD